MPLRRRLAVLAVGAVALAAVAAHGSPTAARAGPAPLPAFPGAVGFGATSEGGRGGDVAVVSTVADDGPGSLRQALATASGPRTIVFAVSGTIDLDRPLRIDGSHLTVAGQTSPGGITLRGYPLEIAGAEHIVVRHLRVRPGDVNAAPVAGKPGRGNADLVGDAADAVSITRSQHVIIDHVSASWGMDETVSVTGSADVTIQRSIISESLNDSHHSEGQHGYGSLVRGTGDRGYSFVGNLWAHHWQRSPAFGGVQDPGPTNPAAGIDVDLVGNVIYDWGLLPTHLVADPHLVRIHSWGNTYVSGPGPRGCDCVIINFEGTADELVVHRRGDEWDADGDGVDDPVPLGRDGVIGPITWADAPFAFGRPALAQPEAARARREVLCAAGASLPRDAVDRRVVEQVRARTGAIIDSQDEVGGWPADPAPWPTAPTDGDLDGMADAWEQAEGLDPTDPTDGSVAPRPGEHTHLELYLAELADDRALLAGCDAPAPPPAPPPSSPSTTSPAAGGTSTSAPAPAVPVDATPRLTG